MDRSCHDQSSGDKHTQLHQHHKQHHQHNTALPVSPVLPPPRVLLPLLLLLRRPPQPLSLPPWLLHACLLQCITAPQMCSSQAHASGCIDCTWGCCSPGVHHYCSPTHRPVRTHLHRAPRIFQALGAEPVTSGPITSPDCSRCPRQPRSACRRAPCGCACCSLLLRMQGHLQQKVAMGLAMMRAVSFTFCQRCIFCARVRSCKYSSTMAQVKHPSCRVAKSGSQADSRGCDTHVDCCRSGGRSSRAVAGSCITGCCAWSHQRAGWHTLLASPKPQW